MGAVTSAATDWDQAFLINMTLQGPLNWWWALCRYLITIANRSSEIQIAGASLCAAEMNFLHACKTWSPTKLLLRHCSENSVHSSASFSFLSFSLTETECDLPFIWSYLSDKLPSPWECIFSWFPIAFKYTRGFCFVCFWSEAAAYGHFCLNRGEERLIKTNSFYYMTFSKSILHFN